MAPGADHPDTLQRFNLQQPIAITLEDASLRIVWRPRHNTDLVTELYKVCGKLCDQHRRAHIFGSIALRHEQDTHYFCSLIRIESGNRIFSICFTTVSARN